VERREKAETIRVRASVKGPRRGNSSMTIRWTPSGLLDVQTDPLRLPSQADGANEASGAMTRCTNLCLDHAGEAFTRYGSRKVNATALGYAPNLIFEMDGDRYEFAGGEIFENEVSIESGLTNAAWSAVSHNAWNSTDRSIFATNGTNQVRITNGAVNLWGLSAPEEAPILSSPATSSPKYGVVYTYVRKVGYLIECESNPSPVAYNTSIVMTVTCTAPTDSQVTHIRVYRSLADSSELYYAAEIALPTLAASISTTDAALGTEVSYDHDPPPADGTVVVGPSYNGVLFMLAGNRLYFCAAKQPEYWPADNYIEVGPLDQDLVTATFFGGLLYVASDREIYQIQGTGASSFFPLPMSANTGTWSRSCFMPVKSAGIYHLGCDGLHVFAISKDEKITDTGFDPVFRGETVGSLPGIDLDSLDRCWMLYALGKICFAYPAVGSSYPDNMLVTTLSSGKTVHYQYQLQFTCAVHDKENQRILAADTDGFIWELDSIDLEDDDGEAIVWQIETKEFGSLRKYFPRYARYDVDLEDGASGNGYVLLDGEVKQTHALAAGRSTKKRLIETCAGDRLAMRISGSGRVVIHALEVQ